MSTRALAPIRRRVLLREVNDRIVELVPAGTKPDDDVTVLCECEARFCGSLVPLPLGLYVAVRRHPARFILRREHAGPGDVPVAAGGGFVVVEAPWDPDETRERG